MLDPTDTLSIISLEEYSGYIIKPMLASKTKIETGQKLIPYSYKDIINKDNLRVLTGIISVLLIASLLGAAIFYGKIIHKEKYGTTQKTVNAVISQNKDIIVEKYYDGVFKLLGRGSHSYDSFAVVFKNKEELVKYLERKAADFSTEQLEYIHSVIE